MASNDMRSIDQFKAALNNKLKIKDLGRLKYFLGIEVIRSERGIHICQCKYALDILFNSGTISVTRVKIPLDQNLKLSKDEGEPIPDSTIYRRLIGRLMYLTITRPDLSYVVQLLSQFMENPRVSYMNVAHKVRYIK